MYRVRLTYSMQKGPTSASLLVSSLTAMAMLMSPWLLLETVYDLYHILGPRRICRGATEVVIGFLGSTDAHVRPREDVLASGGLLGASHCTPVILV